eukprot:5314738-Amphidinium_carterae.2
MFSSVLSTISHRWLPLLLPLLKESHCAAWGSPIENMHLAQSTCNPCLSTTLVASSNAQNFRRVRNEAATDHLFSFALTVRNLSQQLLLLGKKRGCEWNNNIGSALGMER